MEARERPERERAVRTRCESGDWSAAATAAIELYGPEILGFLFHFLEDDELAREVFASFCEDFWRGLPGFRWSCSLRTWAYRLARNALYRSERQRQRQRAHVPLSLAPDLERVRHQAVTTTAWYLRTHVKQRVAAIRGTLDREDQMLLVLRHDRGLQWPEIVQILGQEHERSALELAREAAALRKRYERLLRRLRELYERSAAD